jgi:hypothetical protein
VVDFLAECQRGDRSQAEERLELIRETSLLPENKSLLELTKKLLAPNGMPVSAAADAAHVATATVHECDYLLTSNLRHIANARIRRALERIIDADGYRRTTICTPEELF